MLPDPNKHAFFNDDEEVEETDIIHRTGEWCGKLWLKLVLWIGRTNG